MGLSESILLRLTIVALLATIVFVIAYRLPQKVAATALILLIPFQPVTTQFVTANVILTFVVFAAMLMREKDIRLPLLPQILLVMFAFLISMGLADSRAWVKHALYMINLVSAFVVFWIAYDLALRFRSFFRIVHVFLAMNALVVVYCAVQLIIGVDDKFRLFGMEEFSMMHVRDDYRLTGPFGGAGVISEYFVIMVYMIVHQILTTSSAAYRRILIFLLATNLLMLIATGNRGGFLTLIGVGVLFLWMFRDLLGTTRTLKIAIFGTVLLSVAAAIAVNYTDFDTLFERLDETEFEEGIPDTRSVVWPMAWNAIKDRPIFGHGPRLRFLESKDDATIKGLTLISYPHNLYLFLLFTVGVTGLIAFLIFLGTPLYRCLQTSKNAVSDVHISSFAKTGIIIMIIIFIDQVKVEFLRFGLVDYWHFVFALLGLLVAFCDRANDRLSHHASHLPAPVL